MERKTLAIGIVLIVAIAAGTTGAVIFFMQPESKEKVLTVGQMYLPFVLDIQDAWDSASNDVMRQVVETLYVSDYADTALPIIPMLASAMGTWNVLMTEYTVPLRQGVTFHDGSAFNADDVVFTFNRAAFLFNFTGLNTGYIPDVVELYAYPNHTRIIKDVIKNSDYSVTFVLTDKFAAFVDLLTYQASAILPDSGVYTNAYVDIEDDFMVGTGPFVYEYFDPGVEVVMTAYGDYWGGRAKIDKLVFAGIRNAQARNAALLAGDIQYLPDPMDEMWDLFNSTSGITLQQEPLKRSSVTQYLGMNNVLLNRTWREVISYAFDYDYLIDEIRFGHANRLKSPVPPAIKFSNSTFDIPVTNYTHARLLMQSMGFGGGFNVSDDAQWIAQAVSDPFKMLNYTYNIGNDVREDVLILLGFALKKVGLLVIDAGMSWPDVLARVYEDPPYTRNYLELYFIGWGPDYNDPMNFINPLFTNKTVASNGAQYDGYLAAEEAMKDSRWTETVDPNYLWDNVQLLMEAALFEGDDAIREKMYDRIQELIMTRDFPWCFAYNGVITKAFDSNLEGVIISAMDNDYFYPMYFS